MAEDKPPLSGENHIEGMMQTFESCMRALGAKMEGLKEETVRAFGEVHETVEQAQEVPKRVRAANARFRAFLGFSNAAPQIEAKPNEPAQ